jgi:excisionase family DNA binding protein
MRVVNVNSIIEKDVAAQHELLSTGEAARLLNSSRQHVVDLCKRGDLPFLTVGTHRRVRRVDVESVRNRTLRLTRDQRRSLWLAFAVGGRIAADPETARSLARTNLVKMRENARGQAISWLDEWEKLLNGPTENLLTALTSRSPRGRDLRQNSPFAGMLSEDERNQVLTSWKEQEFG